MEDILPQKIKDFIKKHVINYTFCIGVYESNNNFHIRIEAWKGNNLSNGYIKYSLYNYETFLTFNKDRIHDIFFKIDELRLNVNNDRPHYFLLKVEQFIKWFIEYKDIINNWKEL